MSKGSSEEFRQVSTLVDLLRLRATHQSGQVAYQFLPDGEVETDTLTYKELDQAARAVATLLQGLACKGMPVLLLYPPGLDYIAAFLGCIYAGAIAVPAYPPRPNRSLERLQVMLQDAGAQVALTDSTVLKGLERRFVDCPPLKALHWLATDMLDMALADGWVNPAVTADTLAFLQYTSGSTGTPKGVKVSHGNLIHNSAQICRFFGHSAASVGGSWLPPYHDMGLVGSILQPLYVGMPLVMMPPVAFLQKPLRWLQMISHYRVTTTGGPNFAYDLCVQKTTPEQRATLDLSCWQVAFSGAEPVRQATLERFAEAFAPADFRPSAFYPCYGMAETTLIVTGGDYQAYPRSLAVDEQALQNNRVVLNSDSEAGQAIVSCGQPSPDQGLLIVEPETRVPCSETEVGEIWVAASGSVTQGYWQRFEQTEITFHAYTADEQGPFLRTGDLGFMQDGELFVTGRRKELIIIRGRNYYPKDIETTVETVHEALRSGAGAAFSITIKGQERLVVVQEVERTSLRNLAGDEIMAAVRRAIATQHDLQLYGLQLIKTGSIPKTSSGKIQRFQCRTSYFNNELAAVYSWQLENDDIARDEAVEATLGIEIGDDSEEATVVSDLPPAHVSSPPPRAPQPSDTPQSPEQLQGWLTTWLAQQLQIPLVEVEVTRPFAEYGLDSVAAVELTEALQTELQQPLSPTLAYEYPTIEAVASYLGTQLESASPIAADSPEPAPETEDDLTALLNDLEALSEAEVQALLEQQKS
ncbi:MAG: AMP-binding protein [Leptolyngbyaceae cyanobacterium]